jgi:hypothetical protein
MTWRCWRWRGAWGSLTGALSPSVSPARKLLTILLVIYFLGAGHDLALLTMAGSLRQFDRSTVPICLPGPTDRYLIGSIVVVHFVICNFWLKAFCIFRSLLRCQALHRVYAHLKTHLKIYGRPHLFAIYFWRLKGYINVQRDFHRNACLCDLSLKVCSPQKNKLR